MGRANYVQTNFLGGEWSPFFQGRSDHPKYRSAMNLSRNGYPIEEGAWTRRPGSRLLGPSYKGTAAKVYPLFFTNTAPYSVEFSDGALRFFNESYPVITEEVNVVASISTDNPAKVTLLYPVNWTTGDEVAFYFPSTVAGNVGLPLRNRVCLITVVADSFSAYSSGTTYNVGDVVSSSGTNYISLQTNNTAHTPASSPTWWKALAAGASRLFTIADTVTGTAIDGSAFGGVSNATGILCLKALRLSTPYTNSSWANARIVQNEDVALVLNGTHIPQALTVTPNLGSAQAASASIGDVNFIDGPYLDPIDSSIATVGGLSGVVEVSIAFAAYDSTKTYALDEYVTSGGSSYQSLQGGNLNNTPVSSPSFWKAVDSGLAVTGPTSTGITGFQSTDVGRLMRFFSQPPLWTNSSYASGVTVEFNDVVYVSIQANSMIQPDTDPTIWSVVPSGAIWTWGKITQVTNENTVDVQIMGDPLLYNEDVRLWRLGVYSDTTGYPTCGIFSEGRFWFGGALPNRFDATVVDGVSSTGTVEMSPTLADGTVTDASGISYRLEAEDQNPILWFAVDHLGIVAGTAGGEWLISASQLNDPLTPTSIQARRVTKYKCADIEPRRTGIALVFVQRFKRRVMEFLSDVFTGRFVAPHLTEAAKHLTTDDVEELGYQEELAPILWARTGKGALIGATYRRVSAFTTEAPAFAGWHKHLLGSGRTIESIAVGPSNDGSLDSLSMITSDGGTNPVRMVEQLTTMFDEDDVLLDAWFVDQGIVPDNYYADNVDGQDGLRFTGLWYHNGKTVAMFVAGLDVGDFTVDSNGTVFVPYGSGVAPETIDTTLPGAGAYLFTEAYVDAVLAQNFTPRNGGIAGAHDEIATATIASNPNGATSKIQSFVPVSGTLTGITALNAIADWDNSRLLIPSGESPPLGFRKFSLATGAESAVATISSITSAAYTNIRWTFEAGTVDKNGGVYFSPNGGGNYLPLLKASDADFNEVFAAGASDGSGPPATNGVPSPFSMTVLQANAAWVVTIGAVHQVQINAGSDGRFIAGNNSSYYGFASGPWRVSSNSAYVAAGAPTYGNNAASGFIVGSAGDIYVIGAADGVPTEAQETAYPGSLGKKGKAKKGFSPAGISTTPSTDQPWTLFALIGTLTPTMIDPTWSTINQCHGCIVDQSDNSVLTIIDTSDSVTNQVYLIKISTGQYSRTGQGSFGIAWAVPLNHAMAPGNSMGQGRIKGGLYGIMSSVQDPLLSGASPLWLVDTVTGKYTVLDVPGVTINGSAPQMWDDVSQSLIFYGNYDSTKTGAPTPLNSTVTASNTWFRLFPGTGLSLSNNIPSTQNIAPVGYTFVYFTAQGGALPAVAGYPYVSQGQILRPIAPDQSGSRSGPAFGEYRRADHVTALLHNTIGIQFGVDFDATLQLASLADDAGTFPAPNVMYSGMWRETINDPDSYDSMLSWQIVRPYPATVVSIGASLNTKEA